MGNDVGIGGEDAVHIAPDPHFVRVETGADDGGRVVTAAPPQGGRHTALSGCDVPGDYWDHASLEQWSNLRLQSVSCRRHQRYGFSKALVGHYQILGIDSLGARAALPQDGGQDAG